MRTITQHKSPGFNEAVEVTVTDDRHYQVVVGERDLLYYPITFQHGPVGEVGHNGLTNEAILAIVADRLREFNKGAFLCRENSIALTKIEEALHWLHARTQDRMDRGVEGTREL